MKHNGTIAVVFVLLASFIGAQNLDRRAEIVGGGNPNQGKCTVEVSVDGVAEIQIRGNTASLHDVSGQAPQWRRFQCTGVMPANPGNFRFVGVDGRGRQELTQDPRNGGAAVIRIEDPEGGSGVYTFDVMWDSQNFNGAQSRDFNNGRSDNNGQPDNVRQRPGFNGDQQNRDFNSERDGVNNNREFNGSRGGDPRGESGGDPQRPGQDRYNNRGVNGDQQRINRNFDDPRGRDPGFENRRGGRISDAEAQRTCQDSIRQEAMQRFGNVNVTFRQMNPDNSRGADWLSGAIVVSRPWYSRNEVYRFSCSIDYETGRLRTAHIGVPNY